MAVTLGIDFGTSYSFIVKKGKDDCLKVINGSLYKRSRTSSEKGAGDVLTSSFGIPTVIGYRGNDSQGKPVWCIGEQAELCKEENICRDLKRKMRADFIVRQGSERTKRKFEHEFTEYDSNGKIVTNAEGVPKKFRMNAIDLTKEFFKIALATADLTTGFLGGDQYSDIRDVERIVIGVPANELYGKDGKEAIFQQYNAEVRNIFQDVAKTIGLRLEERDIQIGAEPTFAANAYLKNSPDEIRTGTRILVVDVGGGTSDFVVVERQENGSYIVVYESAGGEPPAGMEFDDALKAALRERGIEASDKLVTETKELLFLPRSLFGNRRDYEEYLKNGRHTWAKGPVESRFFNADRKEYIVAFDREHCDKNCNLSVVYYRPDFEAKLRKLIEKLKKYLTEYFEEKKKPISMVLFAGGSCNMKELREKVIKTVEQMNRDRPLEAKFWGTSPDAGSGRLTASNLIAVGAAFHNQKAISGRNPRTTSNSRPLMEVAVSIPEIKLFVRGKSEGRADDWQEYYILSRDFKNEGRDRRIGDGDFPAIVRGGTGDQCLEFYFEITTSLGIKSSPYPQKGYYRYIFSEGVDPKDIRVIFFADVSPSGEIAVFRFVCGTREVKRVVTNYRFQLLNGKSFRIVDMNGAYADRRNIRMYPIDPNIQKSDGVLYSVNRDRYGFGWKTTENYRGDH